MQLASSSLSTLSVVVVAVVGVVVVVVVGLGLSWICPAATLGFTRLVPLSSQLVNTMLQSSHSTGVPLQRPPKLLGKQMPWGI